MDIVFSVMTSIFICAKSSPNYIPFIAVPFHSVVECIPYYPDSSLVLEHFVLVFCNQHDLLEVVLMANVVGRWFFTFCIRYAIHTIAFLVVAMLRKFAARYH